MNACQVSECCFLFGLEACLVLAVSSSRFYSVSVINQILFWICVYIVYCVQEMRERNVWVCVRVCVCVCVLEREIYSNGIINVCVLFDLWMCVCKYNLDEKHHVIHQILLANAIGLY